MTVPNKSLDEFQQKETIREKLQRLIKKEESKREENRPVNQSVCPVQTCPDVPSLSRFTWGKGKRIVKAWVNEHEGENNLDAIWKGLCSDGHDIGKETVKKNLNRLSKEGMITKIKVGHDSFYKNINDIKTQDKIEEKKQAEEIAEDIDELEKRLADALRLEKRKLQDLKFHSIKIIFNPEYIKETYQRDNQKGRRNLLSSPHTPEDMIERILDRGMKAESIFQRWHSPTPDNIKDINGGFQETIKVSEHTGFVGNFKIQVYGTGSVIIMGEFSKHPIDLIRWREFERYISGLMMGRCGYEFLDMTDYCTVLFEMNVDKIMPKTEVTASGSFSITIRQFDEYFQRKYLKEIDGEMYLRDEIVMTKDVPYSQMTHEILASIEGGVSSAVAIRNQFNYERAMGRINEKFMQNDKTVEFLLRDNQQKGMMFQQLLETNKKILEEMSGRKTKKAKDENFISQLSDTPKDAPAVSKPKEAVQDTKSMYRACPSCGREVWVVLKTCTHCGSGMVKEAK